MNKRIIVLLAILILALVVVGCSSGNNDKNYEAEEKQETGKKENVDVKKEINVEQKAELNKESKKSAQKLLNPRDLERYNGEGDIQMGIIFANPLGQEKDGYLTFVVQMDNHAYNLDEYDLSKFSILFDDKGNSPQGDAKWEVYSGGGHHVINYLLFPDNGFITPDTKYIKLVIKDFIDLPEREFIWEKDFF